MARTSYEALPRAVRAAVDALLGSAVVRAATQPGGWSPGAAARVVCADGTRAFVKAVSSEPNAQTPDMHRREAVVTAALPASLGSPRLVGAYDDGTWVALVLDDVEGRRPVLPADLPAVLAALDRLAGMAAPVGLASAADALEGDFGGWEVLSEAPAAQLTPWQRRHLPALLALEARWPAAATGDRLLHLDLRTDNMLLRPDGSVALVDWPWAAAGAPVFDLVGMLPSAVLDGAGDPDRLLLSTVTGRSADPEDVTCLVAAFTGRMVEHAQRHALPGLVGLREFQAAQGRVAEDWLRARTGWT